MSYSLCLELKHKSEENNIVLQITNEESDYFTLELNDGTKRQKIGIEHTDLSNLNKIHEIKRKFWVHPMNKRRHIDGEFVRICQKLRSYPDKFYKYYRMNIDTYDYILHHITPYILKHSRRPAISASERLSVTLRYLSVGMSFEALASSFLISKFTISLIVREVCVAIYKVFEDVHLTIPTTTDFLNIAAGFRENCGFPHCIGAMDGKHIRIKKPPHTGTLFWNYKQYYSTVMQAVADSNCRFIFVDIGSYGKQSDGGIFEASKLNQFSLNKNNFPEPRCIDGMNDVKVPYLFVADDAYPLRYNIMKPISKRMLTDEEKIFNGRLSRARRCVECAFGILSNKFRLLFKEIETNEETANKIVKCMVVLHNLVIDKEGLELEDREIINKMLANQEKSYKLKVGRKYNHNKVLPQTLRSEFIKYFNGPGAEPYQLKYLK